MMVLDHAPVTGLAIILSGISSMITRDAYVRPPHRTAADAAARAALRRAHGAAQTARSPIARLLRMPIECIPFGGLGASTADIVCSLTVLSQMRVLERRWGSNAFLSFMLSSAAAGVAATFVLCGTDGVEEFAGAGGRAVFTAEAIRVLTGAASLVPLTALMTRYMQEVPSLGSRRLRVPGTSVELSGKTLCMLCLGKLVLCPNGVLQPPTHKRGGVEVSVGVWCRLLLALIGLFFGLASTRSRVLRHWLSLCAEYVCTPLMRVLQPLLAPLFCPVKTATHAVPPHMQPQRQPPEGTRAPLNTVTLPTPGGPQLSDGGRITVGSLAGEPMPTGPVGVRARQRQRPAPPEPTAARPPAQRYTREAAQIRDMGLYATDEQIVAALAACGGDVADALDMLLAAY